MRDSANASDLWADETVEVSPDNLLWKQYTVYVDLFKFYVDMTWKASTGFYAITGAILTYYFSHIPDNNPVLRYSLLLPILLSFVLTYIYHRGVQQTKHLDATLEYISKKLKLAGGRPQGGTPHIDILDQFLSIGRLLFLLVGLGVSAVFVLSF